MKKAKEQISEKVKVSFSETSKEVKASVSLETLDTENVVERAYDIWKDAKKKAQFATQKHKRH